MQFHMQLMLHNAATDHTPLWSGLMLNSHQPLIVNAAGHLAGAIIFGIFLVLALSGGAGRLSENRLSVASAALAWFWNMGSFAIMVMAPSDTRWVIEALSFSTLSLLPAVLMHLALDGKYSTVAMAGYFVSTVAIGLHLSEALEPAWQLHKWALWVITAGFALLTAVAAAKVLLEGGRATRGRTSQIVASMCLLLFAVTFSHFGSGHPPQPWSKELLLHHAGIPVALLILLQDYRFVFVDAFVRFLANVILAAVLALAALRLAVRFVPEDGSAHPLGDTLAVAGLCGLLILFAYLRGIVQRWLTKVVFRQGNVEGTIRELRTKALELRSEGDYLQWASERLAAFVGTRQFDLIGDSRHESTPTADLRFTDLHPDGAESHLDTDRARAQALIRMRLSAEDVRVLVLGNRRGGRRYLSEDLRALNHLASIVAEEVERFRAAEMQRLVSEAELRALQSQINPHFLFNALNTIYGIIPREAAAARRTVLNLAEIFRYFLQSDKILIPLSEELKIIRAYLEIERLRLGPRLQVLIQVDKGAEDALIPILSIQPLVENAIKHGLSVRSDEGWLKLNAKLAGRRLQVSVEDSGTDARQTPAAGGTKGAGVGLANVTRRLQLCFGPDAGVNMEHGVFGTRVEFTVPFADVPVHQMSEQRSKL